MTDPLIRPYPWQSAAWQQLAQQAQQQRLPHALLLSGPTSIGKTVFARAFMERILCLTPHHGMACGDCKSCYLLAAGNHPDCHTVTAKEEGKAIGIDQVRELCGHLGQTSQQGGWKTALITPAEDMTVQSANALLKNLEEPSSKTLILLVSHEPHRLLPTIRSRCQQMRFPVPPANQVADWLQKKSGVADVSDLLRDAGGRPLLALTFGSGDYLEQRATFNAVLDGLTRGELAPFSAVEQMVSARLHSDAVTLDWFQSRVAGMVTALQTASVSQSEATPRSALIALHRFYERLLRASSLFVSSANPDKRLLWEQLLLEWSTLASRLSGAALVTEKSPMLS